jgi:hypothetical protein
MLNFCNNAYIDYEQLLDFVKNDEVTCQPIFNTNVIRLPLRLEITKTRFDNTEGTSSVQFDFTARIKRTIDLVDKTYKGAIITSVNTYRQGQFIFRFCPRSSAIAEKYFNTYIEGTFISS